MDSRIKIEGGGYRYICGDCGRDYASRSGLSRHKKNKHSTVKDQREKLFSKRRCPLKDCKQKLDGSKDTLLLHLLFHVHQTNEEM